MVAGIKGLCSLERRERKGEEDVENEVTRVRPRSSLAIGIVGVSTFIVTCLQRDKKLCAFGITFLEACNTLGLPMPSANTIYIGMGRGEMGGEIAGEVGRESKADLHANRCFPVA